MTSSRATSDPPATRRLDRLLLGYLGLVVGVIVLAPFHPQEPSLDRILLMPGGTQGRADILLNVALFVPLGFLLERSLGVTRTALLCLLASLAIETIQLFLPGRWSTLSDLLANGLGGLLGASGSRLVRQRLVGSAGVTGRLFLDLPLIALVWLLVPLVWIEGMTANRWLVTGALLAAGGVAIAAAGRSNPNRSSQRAAAVWPVLLAWSATAVLPGLARAPLRDFWWARRRKDRRVEPGAVLLVLTGMVPWFVSRIGSGERLLGGAHLSRELVLEWLAIGAGITALGYALAEWRGRTELRWPRGALLPAFVAGLLGWVLIGSAVALIGSAILAALGALLFETHRAHVMAVRSSSGP
jgi:VanZ family protein